jgi:hypothetical protein
VNQADLRFRLATLIFAVLLGLQCIWLLATEFMRSDVRRLPVDAAAAAAARQWRPAATRAAVLGVIRGDLWAEAAFTYADLLESAAGGTTQELARARRAIDHTIRNAPDESAAWLVLAGLGLRYSLTKVDATEALKMSYYTGASEQHIMLLRFGVAARSQGFTDDIFRDFVTRDVRLLLARQQISALATAYHAASPAGKRFIGETVAKIDPATAKALQSIPD